jgi:hydroxymethylbilane synthase
VAAQRYRVGTRESILARLQTDIVVRRLKQECPTIELEVVALTTHGDKVQSKPIAELGARGVFVKELEWALLEREVDFVVHSLKDLPTDMPQGLILAAVLERADPRDVVVSHDRVKLADLKAQSKVATSSRRRVAQLKAVRPDLEFVDMRGNIQTRLRKHDEGQCDAMVLAAAGLLRLGLYERITEFLPSDLSTPAAGQGALAVECRFGEQELLASLLKIQDADSRAQSEAERALLSELGGGCSVPIGALADCPSAGVLRLTACVASLDGTKVLRATEESPISEPTKLGERLANKLRQMGAEEILVPLRQSEPNPISPP